MALDQEVEGKKKRDECANEDMSECNHSFLFRLEQEGCTG